MNVVVSRCKQSLLLSGLLYFHRISDVRMGGTPLTNIRFFHQLCATELSKLIYVTTMWDMEDLQVAEKRETDLVENYWQPLMASGCTTARFLATRESGFQIIQPLIKKEMDKRKGMEFMPNVKKPRANLNAVFEGGEYLAGFLGDRWLQLKNKERFRRQIRKMSSLGSPMIRDVSSDDVVIM